MFAYNTAMQESSKHTPFEVMFGRIARLPVDINAASHYDPDEKLEEFFVSDNPDEEERLAKRRATEVLVKTNIEVAQKKHIQFGACNQVHIAKFLV